MECNRAFCCVVALTLSPVILNIITVTLAIEFNEPERIVLFPGYERKLHVNHKSEHSLGSQPESLELNLYKRCIDMNSNGCKKLLSDKRHHLNLFSDTEKKECLNFNDKFNRVSNESKICISFTTNTSWRGGVINQKWPLLYQRTSTDHQPLVTRASIKGLIHDHSVVEYYFFNPQGYYLYFDENVPLYVQIIENPSRICFIAKSDKSPFYKSNITASMTFRICKYNNTREAHENAIKDVLGKPENLPNNYESIVKNPIWSTRTMHWSQDFEASVQRYAQKIKSNLFPLGTIEIDNLWEKIQCYTQFNETEFEGLKNIFKGLYEDGFNVSLWITPFVSTDCKIDMHNIDDYFVKNAANKREIKTWNDKSAYHVDFTNPNASYWWGNATKKLLSKTGISTLIFVGGESNWYPEHPNFHIAGPTYPDNINAYLETMKRVSDATQYKSLRRGQRFGNFLRLFDYKTEVNWANALSTLIPSLIKANMLGYPFVIPNMSQGFENRMHPKKLFIRWTQAVTFMPAVQYSLPNLDRILEDDMKIIRKWIDIRKNYLKNITDLMKKSVSTGSPLNPPIWWIVPTDPVAHTIDDEYLLGENILVAPVLDVAKTSRDIYFPAGCWEDQNLNKIHCSLSGEWVRNYQAGEDTLPWFIKTNQTDS